MISGTDKIYSTMQNMMSPASALRNAKTAKAAESTGLSDQLDISSSLTKALDFLDSQKSSDADNENDLGDISNLSSLKNKGEMLSNILQMKLKSFEGKLMQNMQAAGIDDANGAKLQDGGPLGILDKSGNPDAAKINQLFENSPELMDGFKEISKLAELVQGLKQVSSDAAFGTMNLGNIAAQYAKESNSKNGPFNLKVSDVGVSYSF